MRHYAELGYWRITLLDDSLVGGIRYVIVVAASIKSVLTGCASLLLASVAAGSDTTLEHMNHRVWAVAQGAPSAIDVMTQTPDGTLWLGSAVGLYHFDGISFQAYPSASDPPLPSPNISALAVAPDGTLWIGFRFGGVSSLRDGHLTNYSVNDGVPDGTVKSMIWDSTGSLWVAAKGGLARLSHQHWDHFAPTQLPTTYGVVADSAGTLWAATEDRVYAKASDSGSFQSVAPRGELLGGSPPFAVSPDGSIWARTNSGLQALTAPKGEQRSLRSLAIQGYSPLLFDAEGNLWLGGGGTLHVIGPKEEAVPAGPSHIDPMTDTVIASGVQSIFRDRESNIWIGASTGIVRFTNTNVHSITLPKCIDWGYGLAASSSGALWISCSDPSIRRGVTEVRAGSVVGQRDYPSFTAAFRDTDGSVWVAAHSGVTHLAAAGPAQLVALPEGTADFEPQAVARSRDGAIWLSMVRKGVYRWANGRWLPKGGLENLPRDPAIVMATDTEGWLWFGFTNNRIAHFDGNNVRLLGPADGLEIGNVTAIAIAGSHIWVGGDLGLSIYDGHRFHRVIDASGDPLTGITGILETGDGAWFNGGGGITHLARTEVDALWRQPGRRVISSTLNYLDGIPGIAQEVRPIPSAVESSDGRLWFATQGGVIQVDAAHSVRNLIPPPAKIWSLYAGDSRYPVNGNDITLPMHARNIRLDFTAGSLTLPERVAFRYRLEGVDTIWQDSGGRRQAFYTNLSPGKYRFQVIAANNDGVWNKTGATVQFDIPPAFYQRNTFFGLLAIVSVALITVLYRLRMRHISIQVRSRLEERLAERERIARELHDTLLQGVQGLILRFHTAVEIMPASSPSKAIIESTLDRADELLSQSRARVKDLRDPAWQLVPLPEALVAEGEERARTLSIQFLVSADGASRDLHPIVREESFMICREALANAFEHAAATRIEVEVNYGQAELSVRIRDDGLGIEPDTLQGRGPEDHWGLLGMRERARRLSGSLEIWSTRKGGTEIELRVPAAVAYSEPWRSLTRPWWQRHPRNFFQELSE
jgi:signal transduction histidine kinase/ligand-binding sensor domain-containing protein